MTESVVLNRPAHGFAALERNAPVVPFDFSRRALRDHDVALDVLFCGICHTDLHMIGPWGQEFPLVPGHEMVGRVTEVGPHVSGFAPGDLVAISVVVDSCGVCRPCQAHDETYCEAGATSAYDSIDRVDGTRTRGGYADTYVADERFVHRIPDGMDLAGAAPLLCAGITSFAPLRHWKVGPGQTVGVVGIGGLGHLGVKFARAMGVHVVAFTTSASKAQDALALGAHEVVLSSDAAAMAAQAFRFDFILDTVSATHEINPYLSALHYNGVLCAVGIPDALSPAPYLLASGRRSLASSGAGGTREIREMLEFCAEHGIVADVEVVGKSEINQALERLRNNDVRFRFVIDLSRD
jgi:uncharacterized zinc-type alcohol dehydrogenase-like protein